MIPATLRRACVKTLRFRIPSVLAKRTIVTEHHNFSEIRPKQSVEVKGRESGSPTWTIEALERLRTSTTQSEEPTTVPGSRIALPPLWLRDNCQCHVCINPDTKQRQFDTFSQSANIPIDDCSIDGSLLRVTWRGGHQSEYGIDWLKNALNTSVRLPQLQGHVDPLWWSADIVNNPPEVKYHQVMTSDDGVKEWTSKIRKYGFCFVDGCPATPEATKTLLERIGPIRETHYGGFYDFTSDLSSKDTAYTSLALDVHTDTTYFTEPAGLQMFHLLSHTEGGGGSTQLVDGFRAAHVLKEMDGEAVELLSKVKMMAHASGNEGISIQPSSPFSVLKYHELTGNLEQVRWNNADRGAFMPVAMEQIVGWYEAAHKWNSLVNEPRDDVRYEVQMVPGRPLIFDNWRVLHGRSAFTGKRRMSGGYINRDDFISRYKMTNYGQDYVRQNGIY